MYSDKTTEMTFSRGRRTVGPGRAGVFLAAALLVGLPALPAGAQYTTPTPTLVPPRFSIEQVADTGLLAPDAPVEFTVTVRNTGTAPANPGAVTIRLSPGLVPVDGMAPYTSQGTYDPVAGEWTVGLLGPIGDAVLVLPAQVSAATEGPCVFSLAELWPDGPAGPAPSIKAFATLRAPGVESCVDLVAGVPGDPSRGMWNCDEGVTLRVPVANLGPDPAHDVLVSVSQDPSVLPRLVFTDARCDPPGAATCRLPRVQPGSLAWGYWLEMASASFNNRAAAQVRLAVTLASADAELAPGDETASRSLVVNPPDPCPVFGVAGPACFIATAAWGSPLHTHVQSLRSFRDRYLLTHAPGRALVEAYYRLSPPLAAHIAAHPAARAAARAVLWPVVFAIEQPALFLALGTGLVLGLRRRRTARRR